MCIMSSSASSVVSVWVSFTATSSASLAHASRMCAWMSLFHRRQSVDSTHFSNDDGTSSRYSVRSSLLLPPRKHNARRGEHVRERGRGLRGRGVGDGGERRESEGEGEGEGEAEAEAKGERGESGGVP